MLDGAIVILALCIRNVLIARAADHDSDDIDSDDESASDCDSLNQHDLDKEVFDAQRTPTSSSTAALDTTGSKRKRECEDVECDPRPFQRLRTSHAPNYYAEGVESEPTAPTSPLDAASAKNGQKAINAVRVHQATPLSVPTHFANVRLRPLPPHPGWNAADRAAAVGVPAPMLPDNHVFALEEILEPEMDIPVVEWNGTPAPMVDSERYIFALLGGGPRDSRWKQDVTDEAAKEIKATGLKIFGKDVFYGEYYGTRKHTKRKKDGTTSTPASQKPLRRGPYHTKTTGVSMGGGQEEPTGFFHSTLNTLLLGQLFATLPFQHITGYVSILRAGPARVLSCHPQQAARWKPSLPRNFNEFTSVFATATVNFGPFTITLPHLDFINLAWGWCAITALRDFDPDKGGHLILWDLRLQGENRFSFTQFTSTGIFRFVANGLRTEKTVKQTKLSEAERRQRARNHAERRPEGMNMYKRWDIAFE
ncbi:hypothetical protein DFH09DRAFT_1100885 [Mycena vulgaris]|nr:hypothetical protein DFH09DRAFT_1100885 [Mycena vulgaris]